MPEQQLSIRSTKARTLAHKLAKKQRRTVSQVVELALEHYSKNPPPLHGSGMAEESEELFWSRIARISREDTGPDIDLEAIINEHRTFHEPIKP
jgi:hypothetical protein